MAFVYVISGDHGRQKVGVTEDPQRRIRELQTGSPFKLKFELVIAVDSSGYDVEGEAKYLLVQHKAEGGDEWFIVPPEVAIAAVMAAVRSLNQQAKVVDPDNLPAVSVPAIGGSPWAVGIAAVPLAVAIGWLLYAYDSDQIGGIAFVVFSLVTLGGFKLLVRAGNEIVALGRWIGERANAG